LSTGFCGICKNIPYTAFPLPYKHPKIPPQPSPLCLFSLKQPLTLILRFLSLQGFYSKKGVKAVVGKPHPPGVVETER